MQDKECLYKESKVFHRQEEGVNRAKTSLILTTTDPLPTQLTVSNRKTNNSSQTVQSTNHLSETGVLINTGTIQVIR